MRQPRIALSVADHVRDLSGMVLTAFELCQRGAECFIVPFRDGYRELCALAPDFVLLPAIRPYQIWRARRYAQAGIQLGFLDAEGVVWSSLDEYKRTFWPDDELIRQLACVCAWSPKVADALIEDRIFTTAQVAVSGCPRFDFYVEPLAAMYKEQLAAIADSGRKVVLINTNFTIANPDHGAPELVIERLIKNYDYDRAQVIEWYHNEQRSMEDMAELANGLARDFPQLDIVFRPHPQERCATYEHKLQKLPNLKLSNQGNVTAWILRASAVIQRSCTTAIEATMVQSLALSPQWIAPSNYYPIPESVSWPCPDYEQLKGMLAAVQDGGFELPAEHKRKVAAIVEDSFYKIDGLAHKRVAAAILDKLRPEISPDVAKCRQFLYGIPDGSLFQLDKVPNRLRRSLGLAPTYSFRKLTPAYEDACDSHLCEKRIAELVAAISRAKAAEQPKAVRLARAHDCGAYLTEHFRGRAVVMTCG